MNNLFIVRVELHGAVEQDYTNLHTAMRNLGFHRNITIGGTEYHLPTAEYAINAPISAAALRDRVNGAAGSIGRTFWVLVTQASTVEGTLVPVR